MSHARQRRRRRRIRMLAGALVLSLATVLSLLVLDVRVPNRLDVVAAAERALVFAGFGIEQVDIAGHRKTTLDEITTALALQSRQSSLSYDLAAARARLEALPWVESASLTRILPDTVSVRISERRPYAVLQSRHLLYLIDRHGHVLEPVGPRDYPGLPVVVGEGAGAAAAGLLENVARYPEIANRLANVQRIGRRRWTIRLIGGIEVLLPAGAPDEPPRIAAALAELDRLIRDDRLLDRAVSVVDLRAPDRLTVRLTPAAAATFRQLAEQRLIRLSRNASAVALEQGL